MKEKADGRLSKITPAAVLAGILTPMSGSGNNVKNDRIGRGVIMSADDLKAKAIGALRRLQKFLVSGFLRDPKLAYILELHKRTAREVYILIFSLVSVHAPACLRWARAPPLSPFSVAISALYSDRWET